MMDNKPMNRYKSNEATVKYYGLKKYLTFLDISWRCRKVCSKKRSL